MGISRLERIFDEGMACLRKERYNRAFDLFSEAMEIEPELPQIHYNRGLAASGLYRWADALESYRNAIRLDPHPDYWIHLGLTHIRLRDWEEARRALGAALELDPASEVARVHLDDLDAFLALDPAGEDAVPFLCADWFDPRLADFTGVDPEIVPKARRAELRAFIRKTFEDEGQGCDDTLAVTEEWALRQGLDPTGVSRFLYSRNLRCDCEVLDEEWSEDTPAVGWDV